MRFSESMRFTKALRGGGNWDLIPPEKIPSPNFWNKVIKGTPYEFTQVQLSKKGLHHSWTRHEISKYDSVMRRNPYMVKIQSFKFSQLSSAQLFQEGFQLSSAKFVHSLAQLSFIQKALSFFRRASSSAQRFF